jgi:hypothetical protein
MFKVAQATCRIRLNTSRLDQFHVPMINGMGNGA